jgi:HD-GYP domain-containing protein (c-di-GMP phosphodiesterase class II)
MTMRLDIVSNDAGELVRLEHARELGAGVVVAIYRLAKLAQMHDLTNQAFLRQLDQTQQTIADYCLKSGTSVNVLFAKKAIYVAGQLLKGSRAVYESANELGEMLEWCGGAELIILREATRDELHEFAQKVAQSTRGERVKGPPQIVSKSIRLRAVNDAARLRGLELENLNAEQRVVRTYASAVVIMRRFFEDLAASRYVLPRRIKRVAQSLVDLSEGSTAAFLGVTEARNANHDDAGKAVNTAILAVSTAREVTTDRALLAQIAMAAMMHDVGRPRAHALQSVAGGLQMPGMMTLSDAQEDRLPAGTAAVLTALGRVNEPSIRRTVLAYEALWLRRQSSLGAAYRGVRVATLHARIIAIARRYNDVLTVEPGLAPPTSDHAIAKLSDEFREPVDRSVLRMLVAALGLLPIGTVVQVTSGEIGEVIARHDSAAPVVRIVVDAQGGIVPTPYEIDIARADTKVRVTRVVSIDGWKKAARDSRPGLEDPPPSRPSGLRSSSDLRAPPRNKIVSSPSIMSGAGPRPEGQRERHTSRPPEAPSNQPPNELVEKMINGALRGAPSRPQFSDDDDERPSQVRMPLLSQMPEGPDPTAPTARGTLEATPLSHVLVYMLDHQLTGSLTFQEALPPSQGPSIEHTIYFVNGVPAKARLGRPVHRLGEVLVNDRILTPAALDDALGGAVRLGLLLGEYLVGHSIVTREVLANALDKQLALKVASLANMLPQTTYSYFRDVNLLEAWGGGELAVIGPLNAILAVVRAWNDRDRISATLLRIGKHPLVFHDSADVPSLSLAPAEGTIVDAIVTRSLSLPDLLNAGIARENDVRSLVYALAVTRQFAFAGQKKGPMGARKLVVPDPTSLRAPPLGKAMTAVRPSMLPRSPTMAPRPTMSPAILGRGAPSLTPRAGAVSLRASAPNIDVPMHPSSDAPPGSNRAPPRKSQPPSSKPPAMKAATVRPAQSNPHAVRQAKAFVPETKPDMRTSDFDVKTDHSVPPNNASDAAISDTTDEQRVDAKKNFRFAENALQKNQIPKSLKLAEAALAEDPSHPEYRALVAWLLAMTSTRPEEEKTRAAIESLTSVLESDPKCERALLYRGKLYKRTSPTEAVKDFEAILELHPKHKDATNELKLLRMHKKS